MRKSQPVLSGSQPGDRQPVCLQLAQVESEAEAWIQDGLIRQLSSRTLEERRMVTQKLLWFLRTEELPACGLPEVRKFLAYVTRGHEKEGGRWGNPCCTRPVKPATARAYYRVLRAFFRWEVEEETLAEDPLTTLKPPIVRADQVAPFSELQQLALLEAAKQSSNPTRNLALLWVLLDTGARANEVCGLRFSDLDLTNHKLLLRGKGNKERRVPFGRNTQRALWNYLREFPHEGTEALFHSDRGKQAGDALTRHGLGDIVNALGSKAGITGVRCSPHTFRHTFAVGFLRNGGNVFTLKELLGHTTLAMTNKYVQLAQVDLDTQHRLFSPGDRLVAPGGKRRK